MDQQDQVTGIILAGGMGRRMNGVDKGLAQLHGRDMVAHVIDALKPNVSSIIINANRNINHYEKYGIKVVADSIDGYQGPLAGIEAGMSGANTPWIFTCPCDSPMQSPDLLPYMWSQIQSTDAQIGLASDGERTQPVFSLLQTSLLTSLRSYLAGGDRKIDRWFEQHKMLTIDCSHYADSFMNINTEAERAKVEISRK